MKSQTGKGEDRARGASPGKLPPRGKGRGPCAVGRYPGPGEVGTISYPLTPASVSLPRLLTRLGSVTCVLLSLGLVGEDDFVDPQRVLLSRKPDISQSLGLCKFLLRLLGPSGFMF